MWLVFYVRNQRIGSLPLTKENLEGMKADFCMSLIHRDATGTEHWNIIAPYHKRG